MAKPPQKSKAKKTTTAKRPTGKPAAPETMQIVLTLSGPNREIVKIEKLGKSGQRQKVSKKELAEFFADDDEDDFEDALADAYTSGVSDAMQHGW